VGFAELEADFREWSRNRAAPPLGSRKFKRLMRAACREVGLSIHGRMIKGLRLIPPPQMLAAA